MTLKFSVITPSYNQSQFIERTIQSVLAQTNVSLEYMVCDGGSTDDTVEILSQYQDHIRWISEADKGQTDAVNKGIEATTGDIIAWLNSDDVYYPDAFQKVEQIFETHPDVKVVYGDANHIDQNNHIIEPYPTESWNYARLKETCFISQPAAFFRRQLISQYGALNTTFDLCMDYELWLRYGQHTDFFYLPEILAGSRLHQNTKTLGQRVAVHAEINDMLKAKFRVIPEKWVLAYASVVADEHCSSNTPIARTHIFLQEALKGQGRWRNWRLSPAAAWILFRLTVKTYYQMGYSQFRTFKQ